MPKRLKLNDLSRQLPKPDEWPQFFEDLKGQSDRGAVLIAGSLVDATVRLALQCRMIEMSAEDAASLFENANAPLSSFSSRIKLGRALGIYGPLLEKKLNRIRQIRNQFAHALVPLDLSNDLIARECDAFPLMMLLKWPLPNEWSDARIRFISACFDSTDYLVGWSMNNGGSNIVVDDRP